MVKAIREWNGVDHIACSTHTLHFCILKELKQIKPYLNKYIKLNQFFESPKQMKRLEDAQREIFARQTGLYNPSTPSTENDNQSNQEDKHKP